MDQDLPLFVLDTNVFIEAHRRYYAQDLGPGFCECLTDFCREERMLSLDRVQDEIQPPDALFEWVSRAPNELFVSSVNPPVIAAYKEMVNWVQGNEQFLPEAKTEFAEVADGWVAAYASVHNAVVVTQEVFNANVRKRVPLPNVCKQFGVDYRDTFEMLRELEVRFDWRGPE